MLDIATPCGQNWDEMKPGNGERHCNACAKTVIDFTSFSDTELIDFFNKQNRKPVCGRFYTHQMKRTLLSTGNKPSLPAFPFWQRIATIIFTGQLLAVPSFGHTVKKAGITQQHIDAKNAPYTITGVVKSFDQQLGNPIIFNVLINDINLQIQTDSSGHFSFILPDTSRETIIYWERQEVNGGVIIAASQQVKPGNMQPPLQVFWQKIEVLPAIICETTPAVISIGLISEIPPATIKKRNFFQRIFKSGK